MYSPADRKGNPSRWCEMRIKECINGNTWNMKARLQNLRNSQDSENS